MTENATDEKEWLKWVYRAYESIYGFEFQGDNLLLARENLLYTFIDYMRYALKRTPSNDELNHFLEPVADGRPHLWAAAVRYSGRDAAAFFVRLHRDRNADCPKDPTVTMQN